MTKKQKRLHAIERRRQKKRENHAAYGDYIYRSQVLLGLGFNTYADYLASELWKSIKQRKLDECNHQCNLCGRHTSTLHHTSYDVRTMQGLQPDKLVPLCFGCHQKIEFECKGKKNNLRAANAKLATLQQRKKCRAVDADLIAALEAVF